MGYTHYMRRKQVLDLDRFEAFSVDAAIIISHVQFVLQIPLADWSGTRGTQPEADYTVVRFNGLESESHETFSIEQTYEPNKWETVDNDDRFFTFCKTARKPYDIAVTAIMVLAKHYFGDDVSLSSDGDFLEGAALVNQLFDYDIPMPVEQQ